MDIQLRVQLQPSGAAHICSCRKGHRDKNWVPKTEKKNLNKSMKMSMFGFESFIRIDKINRHIFTFGITFSE